MVGLIEYRTNTLYARQNNLGAQSIGIKTYPLTEPITAQAVGGVLIQALATAWNRYGLVPNEDRDIFTFSEASSQFFNVGITITASPQSNATGGHPFTNDHAVTTLSLLGYEFSNQQNLSDLVEYNFDVVVDKWMQPEVIIATGSIYNKPSNNAQSSS